MNEIIKSGEVFRLGELLPYQEGKIVNMDLVNNDKMKFVIMSFDAGTGFYGEENVGRRGEELGATSEEHTLIWELRIGSKSVDPAAALTGSSGLLYRETM